MKWWTILITLFALTFAIMIVIAQQFDMQPGAAITQIDPAPAIRVRAVKDPAVYDTIDPSDRANRVKIPLYRGWMLPEVMLPHGVKRSERIAFTVDCNARNRMRPR
ncbi:MAG TPA: hypothetical protein VHS05_05085 [Pyrinomonadaceae bacterium]|jgi:hypothetical protein|nr:hypothetical protein [Pyrinomonadaceae bacterium]